MEHTINYINILSATQWLMLAILAVLISSLVSIKRQRKQQQLQSLSMQSLQRDLRALANAAVGVGGRVLEIERNQRKHPVAVESIAKRSQPASTSAPIEFNSNANFYHGGASQPYEQAIGMAQTGATVDDIVNVCGLSRSEAELVNMMHRLDKAS